MIDLKQTEMTQDKEQISVFYDGSCPLCVREIGFLQRSFKDETVNWQNIAASDLDITGEHEVVPGLSRQAAMKRFHIRNEQGVLISGAGAFVAIWKLHPKYGSFAKRLDRPSILWALNLAYDGFLIIRPTLQSITRKLFPVKKQESGL